VNAVMAIAITEARSACKGEPDILERIRKAMRACHDHWIVTNEAQQFNASLAAAMLESEGDEKDRIGRSGKAFNRLNNAMAAMVNGVPVNLEAVADEAKDDGDDIIPVRKLWDETKRR
jgi:hypothetical protein